MDPVKPGNADDRTRQLPTGTADTILGQPAAPKPGATPQAPGAPGNFGGYTRAKDIYLDAANAAKAAGTYNPAWLFDVFLKEHPDWEARGTRDDLDPNVRMRQSALDQLEPGQESRWQDVFRNSGVENGVQFNNADDVGGGGGGATPVDLGHLGGLHGGAPGGGGNMLQVIMALIDKLNHGALLNGLG
jgi:hypothetical protein